MSKNDITGDKIQTKGSSAAFDEGFDRIFGKKVEPVVKPFKTTELKDPPEAVFIQDDKEGD